MMRAFGAPEEAIDQAIAQAEQQMKDRFTAMGIITNFWANILWFAFLSLITGRDHKKIKT